MAASGAQNEQSGAAAQRRPSHVELVLSFDTLASESSSAHTSFAAPVDGISHDHTSSSKALRLHSTSFATSASAVSFFSRSHCSNSAMSHDSSRAPSSSVAGSETRSENSMGSARPETAIADVPLRSVSVVRFDARPELGDGGGAAYPRGLRPYWTICTSTSPPPPASAISPGGSRAIPGVSNSPLSLRPSPSSSSSSSVVRSVAASARQTRRESELERCVTDSPATACASSATEIDPAASPTASASALSSLLGAGAAGAGADAPLSSTNTSTGSPSTPLPSRTLLSVLSSDGAAVRAASASASSSEEAPSEPARPLVRTAALRRDAGSSSSDEDVTCSTRTAVDTENDAAAVAADCTNERLRAPIKSCRSCVRVSFCSFADCGGVSPPPPSPSPPSSASALIATFSRADAHEIAS